MLEWSSVPISRFKNPSGVLTNVKLRHESTPSINYYVIDPQGKDLDLVAYEELGSSAESLRLLEQNATTLSEYNFDMSKIKALKIPLS